MKRITFILITGLFFPGTEFCFSQQRIVIDASKQYQTIEGLGGMSHFSAGKVFSDNLIKQFIDNLGCTAFRNETPEDYVTSLDNLNNNIVNNGTGTLFDANVKFANQIKAKGVQLVISTTWSPPHFLKQNNCPCQKWGGQCCQSACGTYNCPDTTNYLKTSEFGNYAKMLGLYCKDYKAKTGFSPYALGIQNEPMFNEPYNSALLYASRFAECLRVVGAYFAADPALAGIKFYGAEHVCTYGGNNGGSGENSNYIKYLLDDAATRAYLHAFAVHGYVDGISLDIGSAADWSWFSQKTDSYGKKMWMTETGFGSGSWSSMFNSAKGLFLALKYGHVSLWTYWVLEDNLYGSSSGIPDARTAVGKQFFRFIRPGHVQVESTDSIKSFISMAFKKGSDWTVMMLNENSKETEITLVPATGTTLPSSFHVYQSTENDYCVYLGKTTSTTLKLPPMSITTLYYNGTNPDEQWAPSPPKNVQVTNLTETTGKLVWEAPDPWEVNALPSKYNVGTNGYYVYRKESTGAWTKLTTTAITSLSYDITKLKPGTQYTYGIRSRDELYNISAMTEITFRTPCTTNCPDTVLTLPQETSTVNIYPNPVASFTKVYGAAGCHLILCDLNGKEVRKMFCIGDEETLEVEGLPAGVYMVKVIGEGKNETKKILVLKP